MPSFKGKDGGTWKDASAIYGKISGAWEYAKSAWVKKDGSWVRAWTDCRLYDAGGRDWSAPSTTSSYSGTCGDRTRTDTTTRTKEGCTDDARVGSPVSDPNCTSGCFTPEDVDCDGCGGPRTYYDGSATNCTSYYEGTCGTWNYISPESGPSSIVVDGETYTPWIYGYQKSPDSDCPAPCEVGAYDMSQCSSSGAYRAEFSACYVLEFC